MKVSPLAGKAPEPGMLVNVPRLITAYYTEVPDPLIPAQRVECASFLRRDGSVWTTDKDGITPALLAAEITAGMGP